MVIEVRKDSKKKRNRPNKSHTVLEREFFYDEQGYIFRSEAGGKFWSVSFWIPEEKKEYRRSLKTKDKALALQKAKDEFLTIQGKIKSGVRVWDITVSELIEEYLKHQEKEYEAGKKTKGRVGTIRSQLKHFSEFVDSKTRVSEIKDDDFLDYISFRRKKEPKVQNVTLINEKSTFRNLLNYCQRKGFISRERDWNFGTIKKELVRRNDVSLDDWRRIARYMIRWNKKESDLKVKEQKIFVRSFIMLLCHTGIRFGEARRIQWKDIETYYEEELNQKTKERKKVRNIHIHLSKEKTKNHKARIATGTRGDIIDDLKKFSRWTKNNDLVFVDNDTGKELSKKVYYKLWDEIIRETGLKDSEKNYTYYCLRHTFATWRINANVNVFDLSQILGCSVKFIEDHYGHVDVIKKRKYLTQNMKYDDHGNIDYGG